MNTRIYLLLLAIVLIPTPLFGTPIAVLADDQLSKPDQAIIGVSSNSSNAIVVDVASRGYFTCALVTSGKVKCWGDNSYGQLGDGTHTSRVSPADVAGIDDAISLVGGAFHACALLGNGTVKCWGRNSEGQLGDGTFTDRSLPSLVTGLSNSVSQVSANGNTTCIKTNTGMAKCWGRNDSGQLGDGTQIDRPTPVEVVGLNSGVVSITAGYLHSCAIVAPDSSVVCWGANSAGELGDGTTIGRLVPTRVAGLFGRIQQVASGGQHTCALDSNGAISCWGANYFGQLGNGTNAGSLVPVSVNGISANATHVSAFSDHTCAHLSSGEMRCWGRNDKGQIGDGTSVNRASPVQVSGLSLGVSKPYAGLETSCAPMASGGLKCWGGNAYGQVGDGTTITRYVPVDVVGLDTTSGCTPLPNAITPKVLVLSFNPWLPSIGKTLFEYESSNDPMATSDQMRRDFCEASGGFVNIAIVGRIDRNEFPLMTNGQRMTEAEYLLLRSQGKSYSQLYPGAQIDMRFTVEDGGLNLRVKNHEVDEIWMFVSWQMSGYESRMGGPGAFWINGPTFEVDSGRTFVVMGFENAAGVPNSLHSIGHRVENILDRAYGNVYASQDTPWAHFRKYSRAGWSPNAPIGVGDTENPPNSRYGYDYTNQETIQSSAEDWLNFPYLTGATRAIGAQDWQSTDYGYYKWWYRHMPRAEGVSARADSAPSEMRQNNWWKYIFQISRYPELVGAENVDGAWRSYLPYVTK